MPPSGLRRGRDLTCDELQSCCLQYGLSGEAGFVELEGPDIDVGNPGMPAGALFESDFGPAGPPVSFMPRPRLVDLPGSHPPKTNLLSGALGVCDRGSPTGLMQPSLVGLIAPDDLDYPKDTRLRDLSPDNIGMQPKIYQEGLAPPVQRVKREKGNRSIRNQRVPDTTWMAPQDSSVNGLTSINENCRTEPTVDASQEALHAPAFPATVLVPAPVALSTSFNLPVDIAAQQPYDWSLQDQWRCSIKNTFLTFQCRSDQEEQSHDDQNDRDGGSSQRSSSVPSRFEDSTPRHEDSTPRHQQATEQIDGDAQSNPSSAEFMPRTLPVTHLVPQELRSLQVEPPPTMPPTTKLVEDWGEGQVANGVD